MRDLTQQYAHYHQKYHQEQDLIYNLAHAYSNSYFWTTDKVHKLALAKRRSQYAQHKMEYYWHLTRPQPTVQDRTTTSFPAVQDGYIIPATPTMYQDD